MRIERPVYLGKMIRSRRNGFVKIITGLRGDYILVAKYDDRLEIKSPGRLPNIVTVDNIFTTRFACNPLISRVLTEMGLVRELNEGIPRVFKEMKEAGLPEPEIVETAANVTLILL